MDGVILAILVIHLVLSVLNQLKRGKYIARIKYRDRLGLIPIYTFFAPNPGRTDSHLLYRDEDPNGNCAPWTELVFRTVALRRAFWHPERRVSKGITDCVSHLTRPLTDPQSTAKGKMVEVPYILLLTYVMSMPMPIDPWRRRFILARTNGPKGLDDPAIVFVSEAHRFHAASRPSAPAPFDA